MIPPKVLLYACSILFGFVGLMDLLVPSLSAHIVFGDQLLRSATPFVHVLTQAIGGTCILLSLAFWSAQDLIHSRMCQSIGTGFLVGALIKIYQLLCSAVASKDSYGYESSLISVGWLFFNMIMSVLFFISATHPDAKRPVKFPMTSGGGYGGMVSTSQHQQSGGGKVQ